MFIGFENTVCTLLGTEHKIKPEALRLAGNRSDCAMALGRFPYFDINRATILRMPSFNYPCISLDFVLARDVHQNRHHSVCAKLTSSTSRSMFTDLKKSLELSTSISNFSRWRLGLAINVVASARCRLHLKFSMTAPSSHVAL